MLVSFVLALPIGWNREQEERSAGIRTFPLVSLACCSLIRVAISVMGGDITAQSRILPGIMTGIGFLGGGAILKSEHGIHGTATAASIWNMAVVGAACGYGLYDIAGILVVLNFFTLRFLLPLKRESRRSKTSG
jgi:putative Mg2+ transporter-C (MgtC) family protein